MSVFGVEPAKQPPGERTCHVYWGSHGCMYQQGHSGHCRCVCADDPEWAGEGNVGGHPYYGEITRFYGEDAKTRGLPTHDQEEKP